MGLSHTYTKQCTMYKEVEEKIDKNSYSQQISLFPQENFLGKRTAVFPIRTCLLLYTIGIVKGALTYRASAISYSFFVAIFPFLLVVLNLIPYIPIDDFQQDFWVFLDSLLPPWYPWFL